MKKKSILLFLFFFCVIAAFWTLKPLRTSSVVKSFGPDYYPLIKQGLVVFIPFVVALYSIMTCKLSRGRLVYVITGLFLIGDIALWGLFRAMPSNWIKIVFFYYVDTYITVMVVLFWSYLNDVFKAGEAKKYYGFIGAGGLVGGIVGSSISGWASNLLGDNIILVAALFMVPIVVIVGILEQDAPPSDMSVVCAKKEGDSMGTVLSEGVVTVLRSKYLMSVVAIVGIYEIISTIIDYQFNASSALAFSSRADMAGFQGKGSLRNN